MSFTYSKVFEIFFIRHKFVLVSKLLIISNSVGGVGFAVRVGESRAVPGVAPQEKVDKRG